MDLCNPWYYSVLGVGRECSDEEIRRAYRKLAMRWHPDKWSRGSSSLVGEAKQKFQEIQEAYSVLSDRGRRSLYDAGLYDPNYEDEEVEGFTDFVQEMVSMMKDVKKEEKSCSFEELQGMFWEMAKDFEIPSPQCQWSGTSSFEQTPQGMFYGSSNNLEAGGQHPWEPDMFQGNPHYFNNFQGYYHGFGAHQQFCS